MLAACAAALLVLTGCGEKEESPKPTAAPSEDAPAVELSDLLTAEVPALCEHEPGTKVDGMLPGIEKLNGQVGLDPVFATNEYDAACCGQVSVQSPLTFSADALVPGRTIIARGLTQVAAVVKAAMKQTQAPDIAVPDGLYESLARTNEQFGPFLPDEISCDDGMSVDGGTLICGIPLASGSTFIVYPVMTEWGKYDIKSYEYEL